jgi:hypothetical protein
MGLACGAETDDVRIGETFHDGQFMRLPLNAV